MTRPGVEAVEGAEAAAGVPNENPVVAAAAAVVAAGAARAGVVVVVSPAPKAGGAAAAVVAAGVLEKQRAVRGWEFHTLKFI